MSTQSIFTGLSGFALTPLVNDQFDEAAYGRVIRRLTSAGVDSIGALGSTGSYAYLDREERARVAKLAVEFAGDTPVIVGIGALRLRDVLAHAEDAQRAGAKGVLLAPVSYLKLTDDEVFGLFETVCRDLSVPLCVYDNPGTTHFEFSADLHGRIAQLPQVGSIKIPGMANPATIPATVARLRELVPPRVTIGISGDAVGVIGLNAGCKAWYSVIGGLFPNALLPIARAALAGRHEEAIELANRLEPMWALFRRHGSIRVIAMAAEILGLVRGPCLPTPLLPLNARVRDQIKSAMEQTGLTE